MTKRCTKCGEVKQLSEFYLHKGNKYDRRSECKVCYSKRSREYYKANRMSIKEGYKVYSDRLNNIKSSLGCKNCGERRPWVLVFHHREPSQKLFGLAVSRYSWEKVLKEIHKCEVYCCNCHADLHYQERNQEVTFCQKQE